MAKANLYLDTRSLSKDGKATIKLHISLKDKSTTLSLGIKILPSQWDKTLCKVINHPQKAYYNNYITRKQLDAENAILRFSENNSLRGLSLADIKNIIKGDNEEQEEDKNTFIDRYLKFSNAKSGRTKEIYLTTYKRMLAFDEDLNKRKFENINREWLTSFDNFLAQTSPSANARAIHLRNIRAVFNDAIDDEITTFYPFRKFKIKRTATRKRALSVEELRVLFNYEAEDYAVKYVDMFKLIFMLVGINLIDLYNLKEITADGRIEYKRAKTGRLYSIKVEPEAQEIIDKYRGELNLLNIADNYTNYRNYTQHINKALQNVGSVTRSGLGGKKSRKPLFPELTTYWARHTWATIAASLDIPKETIAAALGHGGNSVTDIYIDFDRKKIDEANRRVIDFVLYDKRQ